MIPYEGLLEYLKLRNYLKSNYQNYSVAWQRARNTHIKYGIPFREDQVFCNRRKIYRRSYKTFIQPSNAETVGLMMNSLEALARVYQQPLKLSSQNGRRSQLSCYRRWEISALVHYGIP